MKNLFVVILLLLFPVLVFGEVTLTSAEYFLAVHDVPDTAGTGYDSADSVNVTVVFQDGTVSLDSVWYEVADAQCVAVNSALYFFDEWDDMNGTDGVGRYAVYLRWYDGSGAALEIQETYIVNQVTVSSEDAGNALAVFDTLIYGGVVWVDAGSNTTTVIGTDGVPSNPVSTIAAAKTIADLIGVKRICFVEGTNETIAATMEHYEFVGVGSINDVTITLNDQDVDGSVFENVILTGVQGGTGLMSAINCAFTATDSLEVHARYCAFVGDISVRGGTSYFEGCYSAVAGNGTPGLDFDGDAATVDVSVRHYSGGLELKGMTSDHTISYESDGQLVINADCTSGNVTARGNMTITDNGTTTSLTKDAVFSRVETVTPIIDTINEIIDTVYAIRTSQLFYIIVQTWGADDWALESRNANADTLFYGSGAGMTDTTGFQVNFHPGGTAGDPPDSTKAYVGAP